MLKKLKSTNQGFTIIEVLTVLAIAALILLIIFLAVPALQRNSRNTSLKNDAAAIAGGVSEYISNNNGSAPTTFVKTGSNVAVSGVIPGAVAAEARVNGSITVTDIGPLAGVPAAIGNGTIIVHESHKCNNAAVDSRATAVYYAVERAGAANVLGCVET